MFPLAVVQVVHAAAEAAARSVSAKVLQLHADLADQRSFAYGIQAALPAPDTWQLSGLPLLQDAFCLSREADCWHF